ncbi:hypothetical protein MUDAN_IGPPGNFN_03646 [Lactiplantibacillus mudanjiangensis]|nr:hypothetical protein MUDAN_IGPPGNFN_03646 [Lactiplantibacillus mudanjiangensis]
MIYDATLIFVFFFFQAEDGIRDSSTSRGLGDVYKRQALTYSIGGFTILLNTLFTQPKTSITQHPSESDAGEKLTGIR